MILLIKQHIIPLQSILICKNIYNNSKINRFNYQHINYSITVYFNTNYDEKCNFNYTYSL